MALLGLDLGGTKLAIAGFSLSGDIICSDKVLLGGRKGREVGALIADKIQENIQRCALLGTAVNSIGISVPGIYHKNKGTVWAPNIPGWEDYPLLDELKSVSENLTVTIDSDRACYMLGELWKGNARGCRDAVFLAVGTGIGAGILVNGDIMRGAHDIAGAIGWMALSQPFMNEYDGCGCFEYHASGEGIAKVAKRYIRDDRTYQGELRNKADSITAHDVFKAFENSDPVAIQTVRRAIRFWGMAVANLVSLFNPEKIILGGGVFGPAVSFIPDIREEAMKWAQPVSVHQYSLEGSALGGDAGVYGAGFLALKHGPAYSENLISP